MSEMRQPALVIPLRAYKKGKKSAKISIFEARLWRKKGKSCRDKIHPKGSYLHGYFENKFRVQFSGKWLTKKGFQYTFYTIEEVLEIVNGEISSAINHSQDVDAGL